MENSITSNVKQIEVASKDAISKTSLPEAVQKQAAQAVEHSLTLKTDYDATMKSVMMSMLKRIEQSDSRELEQELAKIKGQSEARYNELLAKVADSVKSNIVEFVKLLESNGIPVKSGKMLDDLKKGFILVGSNPGIRISIPQLIADAYLLKNVDIFFQVGSAPEKTSMMDFFYQESGVKTIKIRRRPRAIKPGSEITVPVKDIVALTATVAGAGLYSLENETVDSFKTRLAAAAIPGLEFTYGEDKDLVPSVKIKNVHATDDRYIEQDLELSLKTTLSLKRFLTGVVSLAAANIHGALGLGTALFGEEIVSRLTSDINKHLPATVLG